MNILYVFSNFFEKASDQQIYILQQDLDMIKHFSFFLSNYNNEVTPLLLIIRRMINSKNIYTQILDYYLNEM